MTTDFGVQFMALVKEYQEKNPGLTDQQVFETVKASEQGIALLRQYGEQAIRRD